MSTQIVLNGPCSLYFSTDGSYVIAGGAGSAEPVPYSAADHPVKFIINHEDWQERFSPAGAAAFFAFSANPESAAAVVPEQTVITFDGGAAKSVTIEQANNKSITKVNTVGAVVDVAVEATTIILLRVVIKPTACTKPPCDPSFVSFSLELPPV